MINIALTYAAFVQLRQGRIRNSDVRQRPLLADICWARQQIHFDAAAVACLVNQTVCGIENKGRLVILFPAQIPDVGKGCRVRSDRALGLWLPPAAGRVPTPCTSADPPVQAVFSRRL